ncbi:hypothetical protein [Falsiroseomonas tokyonensis]|uniref:Uncharacterized protein n=1 Tax=Falsiroseomonas tokyonensis TaxID=430521 RepID=A0ABV7BUY9_9PROT|nr:hypothetical protein [Falsiroseomonas tokyonensis]MBU8538444.1 hypothetical protein [Falsiroseomonas tokyonensis]
MSAALNPPQGESPMAPGALVAGAWLGPALAALAGLALLRLAGISGEFLGLLIIIGLSLLAGAPAALLAARRGLQGLPLGLAMGGAGLAAFLQLHLVDRLGLAEAVPGGLAAAALVLLWTGLTLAAGFGLPPLAGLAAGLLAGGLLAWGLGGLAGGFGGLALAAAIAGFVATVPAAALPLGLPRRLPRGGTDPVLAGLALALAVLAGPLSTYLLGGPLMAVTLALLVALPGLVFVALARDLAPLPLATRLLGLQAMAVVLGLVIGSAPAAAGLVAADSLPAYRLALLGAGFLPAFAALLAALLAREAPGAATLAAGLLAALSAGLGPLLGWVDPRLSDHGALLAPLLATGFAFWLLAREQDA